MAVTDAGLSFPRGLGNATGETGFRVKEKLPVPVAIYLLAIVIPTQFFVGPLFMTNVRLLLLILTIPLLAQLFSGKFGKVYATDYLFVAFIGWMTISLALNNPEKVIQNVGSTGIEFLGGYALGRAYIRKPEQFLALCRWLIIIVLCTLPLAVFETLTDRPPVVEFIRKLPGLTSYAIYSEEGRLGLERVQVVFTHPIHYGLFCSVAFSMAFVAMRDQTTTTWRYISSALVAFCGFLALSSGALLAIALQLGLIIWAAVFHKTEKRWWILVGMFAFAYVVIDILSNRTPIQVFLSYATFSSHTAFYRALIFEWGMVNVGNHPIFGLGFGDWIRPHFMYSASVDNFWLVNAMRYGVPAFLLLAIGYILPIAKIMRRDFATDPVLAKIRRAWVFTFMGLTFTLCTVHVWGNIYSFVFFLFGAGFWLITVESAQAEDQDTQTGPVPHAGRTAFAYSRNHDPLPERPDRSTQAARPKLVYARPPANAASSGSAGASPPVSRKSTPTRYSRFDKDTSSD